MVRHQNPGQILIIALIFLVVVLVLAAGLLSYVFQNVVATRIGVAKEQALQLADAGVDKAVWQLNQTAGSYTGETGTVLGSGVFDVSVNTINSSLKELTATGYVPNKITPQATKQVKVRVTINTVTTSFFYGVQVGQGGLTMNNNSTVSGNVYSDGPIAGANGAVVTGDAYSAGSTGRIYNSLHINGNAYAHRMDSSINIGGNASGYTFDRVTVGGNAYAYSISNCTITGNASFTTKTACTIGGTTTSPYAGAADPASQPLPIPDSQITDWKTQAANGGVINGDYSLSNGAQGVLGPKKIVGNLTVSNNARLTLTGPLWVTGNIAVSNNGIIALAASYGNNSEVIIADGTINVSNNAIFQRAGPTSYILMLTTSTSNDAFDVANNADALIAYAANGTVEISNNAVLREVTGWAIELSNNTQVIYETGLANLTFSSGPGGSWVISRGTWRETN